MSRGKVKEKGESRRKFECKRMKAGREEREREGRGGEGEGKREERNSFRITKLQLVLYGLWFVGFQQKLSKSPIKMVCRLCLTYIRIEKSLCFKTISYKISSVYRVLFGSFQS